MMMILEQMQNCCIIINCATLGQIVLSSCLYMFLLYMYSGFLEKWKIDFIYRLFNDALKISECSAEC
jgi:hypothetical protein